MWFISFQQRSKTKREIHGDMIYKNVPGVSLNATDGRELLTCTWGRTRMLGGTGAACAKWSSWMSSLRFLFVYVYIIIYIMYDSISAVTSLDLLPSGVFQTYVQKNIEKQCMLQNSPWPRKDYINVSFTTTYDNAMLEMLESVQNTLNTEHYYNVYCIYYNIPHGQRCTKVANVCKSQISEWWRPAGLSQWDCIQPGGNWWFVLKPEAFFWFLFGHSHSWSAVNVKQGTELQSSWSWFRSWPVPQSSMSAMLETWYTRYGQHNRNPYDGYMMGVWIPMNPYEWIDDYPIPSPNMNMISSHFWPWHVSGEHVNVVNSYVKSMQLHPQGQTATVSFGLDTGFGCAGNFA